MQIAYILESNASTQDGFVAAYTLGFKEGSVIAVFAVDYLTSSSVTEDDLSSVLSTEVATGNLTDGYDVVTVTTLSSIEGEMYILL